MKIKYFVNRCFREGIQKYLILLQGDTYRKFYVCIHLLVSCLVSSTLKGNITERQPNKLYRIVAEHRICE